MTGAPDVPPAGQFGPDVYATWRRSSLGDITDALESELLFHLIGPLKNRSFLDVGCGDGTLALLASKRGAALAVGCDPDLRMMERAASRTGGKVYLTAARSQALPFPDGCFDVVTCVTVLSFVPNAADALREIARVLRPGGRLVLGDLGKWSLWATRRRVRGWLGAQLWRGARFRTARELAILVRSAGLSVTSVNGAIFFPPSVVLARLMAPLDTLLGRITTIGAAFVAIQADKPDDKVC